MAKKQKFIVDINSAVESWKKNNPEKEGLNREKLRKKLKCTYQTLTNYQNGRVPDNLILICDIIKITGIPFEELVKKMK